MVLILAGVYSRVTLFLGKGGGLFEEGPYLWVLFRGGLYSKRALFKEAFFGLGLIQRSLIQEGP